MTKSWTTDLPKFNWSNINEHPAPKSWGQIEATQGNSEWKLSDIDPSEWMASEESFDLYEQMEIPFESGSSEEQFKAMCEQHRNK